MSQNNNIGAILESAVEKIKDLASSSTVIGQPIDMGNGNIAVPVCKVTVGLGSGGSDIPSSKSGEYFGGGAGAGVSIVPIAFLVSGEHGVRILQLDTVGSTADNVVRAVPEIIDKINDKKASK